MNSQQLQDLSKTLALTLSIVKAAPGLKGVTTPKMPSIKTPKPKTPTPASTAKPGKLGVGSIVRVHGKEMRIAGIKDPTAKNWMKKYQFEGLGPEKQTETKESKEKQPPEVTGQKQAQPKVEKPKTGPTLQAAPKQYQTSVKNTLKEKLDNTLGLIRQYKKPTLVPEAELTPSEIETVEPKAAPQVTSSLDNLESQLTKMDPTKLSSTDKILLDSNLKALKSLNKLLSNLDEKELGLVNSIMKDINAKTYNPSNIFAQTEAAKLDPQSVVQTKQAELEQIENRLGITSDDKEYSQLQRQKKRIESQIKAQSQRVDQYEVSKMQTQIKDLEKKREHCYQTKGHSNPVCGTFNEQINQLTSEIQERKASSAVDFSDPKAAKVAITKINDRATLQILLDKATVEKVPGSVTKAIQKRMDEVAEAETTQLRREQEKQFASEFEKIEKNPSGYFKIDTNAPVLQIPKDWDLKKAEIFAAFPLQILNKERQSANLKPFTSLKEYHAEISGQMDKYLTNNGLKNLKVTMDPAQGTMTLSAKDWDKYKRQFRTGKDTNFTVQNNAVKGTTTLAFTNVGGLKTIDVPKASMVEAADKIDQQAKANPQGPAFKVMGASEDGSPSIQTMDGKKGINAEMVYAGKGSGKTEKLEGSVMANLIGNTKGNYKVTVVDPKGAAFNWLVKEDGSLRDIKDIDPKYKDIAPHLIEAVKDGRMKLYSTNVKALMTQASEKAKQWLTTMVKDLSQTEAVRSKFAGDDFMSRPYKMGLQDVHLDEMNELVDNLKATDPLLYNNFINTISTIIKGASRKGGMPMTMYAQSPIKDAKFKAATGALDAVSSMGGTDNQSIRYAHPGFKFRGVEAALGRAGNGRTVSLTPDGVRTYNTLAVGPTVKDELGKLPVGTKQKSFPNTDIVKSQLTQILSGFTNGSI